MPAPLPLVVSIQSQVAFGHVGNSAAALPMRACGVEVVEVPTTLLSNHPHYPTMRGRILEPELVADLLAGLVERGVHARAAVILSGFLGQAGTATAVADFVRAAKAANPGVTYACDPVMGDADIGFFADAALRAAFAATLVPLADLILPNAFELATLAGRPIDGPEDVDPARRALGLEAVVATSVPLPGQPRPPRDRHRHRRRLDHRRGRAPARPPGRHRRPPRRPRRRAARPRDAAARGGRPRRRRRRRGARPHLRPPLGRDAPDRGPLRHRGRVSVPWWHTGCACVVHGLCMPRIR